MEKRTTKQSLKIIMRATSLALTLPFISLALVSKAEQPNIIFMMADDLGYNDLACYGQKIYPTPHTDRLAREGIRLTSAYSPSSVCSPTRYSVLTGTDPCRRFITSHVLFNAEPLVIKEGEPTVASLLKQAGYATGVIGKWHVGLGDNLPRDINNPGRGANQIGFDYSFLVPDGHNMLPLCYHENGNIVGGTNPPFESYLIIQERGGKLLQHNARGKWDNRRPGDQIGITLAERADAFLEKNAKKPFFLYYATCQVHGPFTPQEQFQGKSGIGALGDFVMEFDWMVGRVMAKLDELGLTENTLLIVTSDNGGLSTQKNPQTGVTHRPSDPWRDQKGSIHEGGHRVPFIARWPRRIRPGTTSDEIISLVDLTASAAALNKIELPPSAALDSYNMLPALLGNKSSRSSVMLTERGMKSSAIRQGDWKLIKWNYDQKSPELYHLGRDPYETNNLFAQEAERAQQMQRAIDSYFQHGASRPEARARGKTLPEIMAERAERDQKVDVIMAQQPPRPSQVQKKPNRTTKEPQQLQLEPDKLQPFKSGARLFIDRTYTALEPPQALHKAFFLPVPLSGEKTITCKTEGMVWIATPAPQRNRASQEAVLLTQGFKKLDLPEFSLWNKKDGNRCSIYEKKCAKGDVIKFSSWALPLFFAAKQQTAVTTTTATTQNTTASSGSKPNIVLILADDLGYGDLSCYGNKKVRTPNLDRMAAEGMRFTDFYANGPMCSPTRAAMLTGRFQQRCGVPTVGRRMHEDSVLIPQRLRDEAGYATAMFGKWHLSGQRATQQGEQKQKMPMDYGFDLFRGFMGGFIDPVAHLDDFGQPDWWLNNEQIEEDGYGAHLLTRHAIDFMKQNAGKRPFFVYLSLPDIHFPWMTPDDQPYYKRGSRSINFAEELNRLGPHEGTPRLQAAVHRMIEETDKVTGWVLSALREMGIAENTLVLFTSDNGGIIGYNPRSKGQISDNGPLRGEKKYLYEGGIRVPAIAWQPGTVPSGVLTGVPAQTIDLFPTFLDMAGLHPPAADTPFKLDGITLLPLLHRGIMPEKRPLFWSFGKACAMRHGNWKLLKFGNRYELYDLSKDIGESRDVSAAYPELMNEMRPKLEEFERDVGI